MDAIEAKDLVKTYVTKKRRGFLRSKAEIVQALRGISLSIEYGEIVGLLGPNGAGKTTTIKILATLLKPDSGEVYIDGVDALRFPNKIRRKIGVMLSVEKGFYGRLTGRENLLYFGALYGLTGDTLKSRVESAIRLLELDKLGAPDKLYEEFSLGMKARLAFARAIIHDPPIMLLDEPTLGLDPFSARKIRAIIRDMAHEGEKAILYTTHNMFEAEIVCDRILLIDKGLIRAEGSVEDLKGMIPRLKLIRIHARSFDERLKSIIAQALNLDFEVKEAEGGFELRISSPQPEDDLNKVLKVLVANGVEVAKLSVEEPSLEDAFVYLAGGSQ
jgi:ABC-2 type transport system ATP-binding protein